MAAEPTVVVTIPAALLREMAEEPQFGQLINETLDERWARLKGCDAALPGRIDHGSLRALGEKASRL